MACEALTGLCCHFLEKCHGGGDPVTLFTLFGASNYNTSSWPKSKEGDPLGTPKIVLRTAQAYGVFFLIGCGRAGETARSNAQNSYIDVFKSTLRFSMHNISRSACKMGRVTTNGATKAKSTAKRSYSSVMAQRGKKPKTDHDLIQANTLAIKRMKTLMPKVIYTDYQKKFGNAPFISGAPAQFFNITNDQLMSPFEWTSVLRKDTNVEESSQTMVKRMQINLRYSLGGANWCQITTFIVSIRPDATDRIINEANLVEGNDYIVSDEEFQPRLNPAVFKVHFRRHVSLMSNGWKQDKFETGGDVLTSNSSDTLKKGQVNIDLDLKIRQPGGQSWRSMDQSQFGPQSRWFQLTFFKGQTNDVDDDPTRVDTDVLYTCVNY